MSPTLNSNFHRVPDSNLKHLVNFENLPFFSISHLNFFNFNSFQSSFINIPVDSNLDVSPSITQTRSDDRIYREASPASSETSTSSHNTTATYSSLPPLEPNSDISENLDPSFIQEFATLNLIEPPRYTTSGEDPPAYKATWNNNLIHRRIRILERESVEVVAQLCELRDSDIERLSADIEEQIGRHLARYQESIEYLRRSL